MRAKRELGHEAERQVRGAPAPAERKGSAWLGGPSVRGSREDQNRLAVELRDGVGAEPCCGRMRGAGLGGVTCRLPARGRLFCSESD